MHINSYILLMVFLVVAFVMPFVYIMYFMQRKLRNTKKFELDLKFKILLVVLVIYYLFIEPITHLELSDLHPTHPLGFFFLDVAMILHAWSLKVLDNNFSDSSTPVKHAQLTVTGPYAFVRHPIYSSFFFEGLFIIITFPYFKLIGLFFMMLPFYRLAIEKEEEKLVAFFGKDYKLYMKKVRHRIIPFIY